MAVIGLDHIQLAMPSGGEDQARSFYGDILGMCELAKPDNLSPHGCWFTAGALDLHLGVDPDFQPAKKAHPALQVDDISVIEQTLARSGFPILTAEPIAGFQRFFTEDPFGNRIEIMQCLDKYT